MKINIRSLLGSLLIVTLLLGLLAISLVKPAHAQTTGYSLSPQQPNFYRMDTNLALGNILTTNSISTNAIPASLFLTNGQAANWVYSSLGSVSGLNQPTNGPFVLTVRQNQGVSVFVTVISSNACLSPAAGAVTLGWDVSPDRLNDTTTQPLKFTVPTANSYYGAGSAVATNLSAGLLATNVYWTNWPSAVLSNVRTLQLTTATNALENVGINTNSVIIQLRYSYSGV